VKPSVNLRTRKKTNELTLTFHLKNSKIALNV
jgi:hypothetical protein